jgi:hypothetical protein
MLRGAGPNCHRGLPAYSFQRDGQKAGLKFQETAVAKRTTHRSSSGTKLYAVRDKQGRFKDIQTYKRAHGQDVRRKAKKEK